MVIRSTNRCDLKRFSAYGKKLDLLGPIVSLYDVYPEIIGRLDLEQVFDRCGQFQFQVWTFRIIRKNNHAFCDLVFEIVCIYLQHDFTLATGRDNPVKPGNRAASPGLCLFYYQLPLSLVTDNKGMDDFFTLGHLPVVML